MSRATITHPADGIYYLNAKLIRARGACATGRQDYRRVVGDTGQRVRVTLALVEKCVSKGLGFRLEWLADRMMTGRYDYRAGRYNAGTITREELNRILNSTYKNKAKTFMDALLARAEREGRYARPCCKTCGQALPAN